MNKQTKLFASNELIGALAVETLSKEDINAFASNPQDAIAKACAIDVSSIDIQVLKNTDSEVILALPYYDSIDISTANALADNSLDEVAGGEILISIFATIGIVAGSAMAAGMVGATTTGCIAAAAVGGVIGAAVGGTVVAGAVGGAIAGASVGEAKKSGRK